MRTIFDTNTVVSALVFSQGRLSWLRGAWRTGVVVPLVSRATTSELLRVLSYPKFKLVLTGRVSLGRAAVLGMSRYEAIRWYNACGLPYPNLTEEELEHELAFVKHFSSA